MSCSYRVAMFSTSVSSSFKSLLDGRKGSQVTPHHRPFHTKRTVEYIEKDFEFRNANAIG